MSSLTRLVLIVLLLPMPALAQDVYVPDELQQWQEWVLHDKAYRACPFLFDRGAGPANEFVCVWPGRLDLSVATGGARFEQRWTVYAEEQWVRLPGDTNYWPDRVTANGRSIAVVLHGGHPSVYLAPGEYTLAGSFAWDDRPGTLSLPWQTGLLSLEVDGQQVIRPDRNNQGVFLGQRRAATQARDSVSSDVYRQVQDDIPTRLTTRLVVEVAGGVREELFGPILPEGFVPLSIESDLPARLEPDGNLRVQVRPGRWQVVVTARAADVLNSVTMATPVRNLPDTEIWSYASNDVLRVTAPEGLTPVDPQQADVPIDWSGLPAFRATAGESLQIVERSRGIVSAENDLQLARTMWLSFDRDRFVVNDEISGTMRTGWRLDMSPPFTLLAATADMDNLLVTYGEGEGQTGIELRSPYLDVEANAVAPTGGELPATSWDARFNQVEAVLHLPPGHKLLAAPGVDVARGSWASQWQLLDFFLVLIVAIAAGRLFGAGAGVVALAAMVLSLHQVAAPQWLWLNLLIAIALLRVAPAGRLRQAVRIYQGLSAAVLLLALIPFAASQLRIAIYPQLEPQQMLGYQGQSDAESRVDYTVPPAAPEVTSQKVTLENFREVKRMAADQAPVETDVEEIVVAGNRISSGFAFSRYAPNAIVQAGAGIPSWQWNSYALKWDGPVDADQSMRLVILPRWLVSLLRVVEVALLLLFVAVLAAEILKRQIRLPGGIQFGRAAANGLAGLGLLAMMLLPGQQAHAQMPDAEILRQLEERLLQAPDCVPRCAEIVAAKIEADAAQVRITLSVHALENVAVPLPGSDAGWRPAAIQVNGAAASEVIRGQDRALWIRLAAGRHDVVMNGAIPAVDSLEIPFPAPPRVVTTSANGWLVAGVKDRRLLSGSLQLTRLESEARDNGTVRWESSRFPPFVEVTRTLQLDLDWYVETTVQRVAPTTGALTLEMPLLDGESVLTDNLRVDDGKVLVSMAPTEQQVSWRSRLQPVPHYSLQAATNMPWQETWRVAVSNIWHADFSGVPESDSDAYEENVRVAVFYPRGGETLDVTTRRPEGSAGSTLAFDAVQLVAAHGEHSSDVSLALDYRSTRGAQHALVIPDNAEVTDVIIDGRSQSLRAQDGRLDLPILPGEHNVRVTWRADGDIATRLTTPPVDIGAPASNITLQLELPQSRWLLATSGPRLGPAVLYWSELAVLVLFAIILGRTRLAPLGTWQWLLLGVGFSTFGWPALGWVVAWLLLSGVRERWKGEASWWQFNLVQVAFALLSVIALSSIVTSVPIGLLGEPDMHVAGNNSYGNSLQWFADQSDSALPSAAAISVPMWVYKALILAWALWLSFALLRWLPWVWRCFSTHGYWRPRERAVAGEGDNA